MSGGTPRSTAERGLGWLLTGPAFAVMLAVTAYPMLRAVWLSLFSYRLTDPAGREWVGLRNYAVVLGDPLWWEDVATTVTIAVVTVAVELALGMALALLMHHIAFGRRLVRTALLVPYGVVTVVSGFAWRYAFALDTGFVNGWLGLRDLAWFGHRGTALLAICLAEIWKTTPFMSLLLLAGLAQVPEELHEAARMDGATAGQRFLRVTLPAMRSTLLVAVLFRALDAYRVFDTVFVMTAGAQRTETVSFLAYRQMIGRTALGLGSAVSVLLFLGVVVFAAGFVRLFRLELAPAEAGR
ncbi:MAG TPA: sugar ABC transporter permease [Anaeromyxobacteraceae bacterium]